MVRPRPAGRAAAAGTRRRRRGVVLALLPAALCVAPACSAPLALGAASRSAPRLSAGAGVAASTSKPKPKPKPAKPKPKPAGPLVTIAADSAQPGAPVPAEFLGLSFEMSSLAQIARYSDRGDFVTMLRSLGPGVLRFGGVSADTRIAWTDSTTPRPSWASGVIDVDDLDELAALANASGWHVILTLGIVHFEPRAAAREVAAAKAALGGSLAGIELGNEPNAYALHAMRAEPWTFTQYAEQIAAYRSAIEAAASGVPLLGPDTSGSSAFETWGPGEAVAEQPAVLTGHHYPLGCEQTNPAPSIASLLSEPIRLKEIASVRRYVAIAQAANLPFRLDETNTVSCGGVAGISDTFASALWAAGFLPQVMDAGAIGVNMHGNPANCAGYSPVCALGAEALSTGELVAQPEWYALLMLRGLVGDRPLATTVARSPSATNVHASGFLAPNGRLDFVVTDDEPAGRHTATVRLSVGAGYTGASTLALTGQSLSALSGTELGGREVAADGSWQPGRLPWSASSDGVVTVQLAAASAALVSVSRG
jgi:hypothetical protein